MHTTTYKIEQDSFTINVWGIPLKYDQHKTDNDPVVIQHTPQGNVDLTDHVLACHFRKDSVDVYLVPEYVTPVYHEFSIFSERGIYTSKKPFFKDDHCGVIYEFVFVK